ncbi:hypothetical protein [Actinomadura flavalba]|uniref:hypothetical protein n=1 Tax=Actinomadura flavalba TaxID=1120938 RepID=UPI000369381C|nr:hypothetical protein [Actinomadura flavalba]
MIFSRRRGAALAALTLATSGVALPAHAAPSPGHRPQWILKVRSGYALANGRTAPRLSAEIVTHISNNGFPLCGDNPCVIVQGDHVNACGQSTDRWFRWYDPVIEKTVFFSQTCAVMVRENV